MHLHKHTANIQHKLTQCIHTHTNAQTHKRTNTLTRPFCSNQVETYQNALTSNSIVFHPFLAFICCSLFISFFFHLTCLFLRSALKYAQSKTHTMCYGLNDKTALFFFILFLSTLVATSSTFHSMMTFLTSIRVSLADIL